MKKLVHVVPHTHWDREWYFTTSRSRVYLMRDVEDVLDVLEKDEAFHHFVLDGQASLLDDYLSWKPEDAERVKNLVKSGKLLVGPWYTQTDLMLISGESIARNLYYGIKRSQEFGDPMMIGYMPDSFGQSANMPQIYKAAGINETLFWRGVAIDETGKTEFKWRGSDGTDIEAYHMPFGYYIGGFLPNSAPAMQMFLQQKIAQQMLPPLLGASGKNVLFPSGFDQSPVRRNLPAIIKEINKVREDLTFEISSFPKYIDAVRRETNEWLTLDGELMNSKFMRIHKSIYSSRADLKSMNTRLQHEITNTLEPLLALGVQFGLTYPKNMVEHIWKLMFENAAHDSIGSCVSDTTNEDIGFRYKQVRDIMASQIELTQREIARRISAEENEVSLTIFNTLPYSRAGVVVCEAYLPDTDFALKDTNGNILSYTILHQEDQTDYIKAQLYPYHPERQFYIPKRILKSKLAIAFDDVPAMGFSQVVLVHDTSSLVETVEMSAIENSFYAITANTNGTINIKDKRNNKVYLNQLLIEESGDDGDSFNYSVPRQDMILDSSTVNATMHARGNDLMQTMSLNYIMMVPKDLEERAKGTVSVSLPIQLDIVLMKDSAVIEVKATIENNGDSHRVRVLLNSGIASSFSISDQQFGSIHRPVVREDAMKRYEASTMPWNEMPIAIEPCQTFVALADDTHGAALLPKDVREYEIIGDDFDTIALTLYRTFGMMGKENLVNRPGRASGDKIIETPDAQLHRKLVFEFGVTFLTTSFADSSLSVIAREFNTPLTVYQDAEFLNSRLRFVLEDVKRTLPKRYSWFKTEKALTISAIKRAENRHGTVIRMFNGGEHTLSDTITNCDKVNTCEVIDLMETTKHAFETKDETIKINDIKPCQFISLYFE